MSLSQYFVMSFTLSIGNSDEESETVNISSNNIKLNNKIYECGTISSENIQMQNTDILKFNEMDLSVVGFYGNQITLISDNNEMTFYSKEKTVQESNDYYIFPIQNVEIIQNHDSNAELIDIYNSCCRKSCLNIYRRYPNMEYEEPVSYFSCSELIDIIVSFEKIERFKNKDNKNCTFKNLVLINPNDEVQNHKYKCEWIETETESQNNIEKQEDTEVKIVLRKIGTQEWYSWFYKKYKYSDQDTASVDTEMGEWLLKAHWTN